MRESRLAKRLACEEVVVGTFLFGSDPGVAEVLGHLGFDFVILDMEHSAKDWSQLESLIRACEIGGAEPLVRMSSLDRATIGLVLDLGACGIIVPHIMTGADAKALADAVRYPPSGSRGRCSAVRATSYSVDEWVEHQNVSNRNVLAIAMIEDAEALENAQEIAATEGIDAVCIGRVDLGGSMGLDGQRDDAVLFKAIEQIVSAARAEGVHVAMPIYRPEGVTEWLARGCRMVIYSQDYKVLAGAYGTALDSVRRLAKTPDRSST